MMNIFLVVVGIYAAFTGGLYLFQRNLLYHPSSETPSLSEAGVPDMRAVTLTTEDGLSLLAWYKEAKPGRPTIVLFHGNAGHIGYRGFKARIFMEAGVGVLLVEYRGYGGNPGAPTEEGLLRDGRAALAFLEGQGLGGRQIVLYGESLGSGVAVPLAAERAARDPVAAVVLEAPFTSIADVAAHHYPFVPARTMMKDRFDSLTWVGGIKGALLVLHGLDDRIIPVRFGRKLFAAAREPKQSHWIAGGGHNDLYSYGAGRAVLDFLDRLFPPALPGTIP